jgi:hypothetical protein
MATLRIGGMVAKVLPSAPQTGGTARPHLLRISGARKSVVAVVADVRRTQCPLCADSDQLRLRSERTLGRALSDKAPTTSERCRRSEPFGMQQRENQIGQQADGNKRGERIVKDHGSTSSSLSDGMGVRNRKCEEAEREPNHQQVHHGDLPCALNYCYCFARSWVTFAVVEYRRNDHRRHPHFTG